MSSYVVAPNKKRFIISKWITWIPFDAVSQIQYFGQWLVGEEISVKQPINEVQNSFIIYPCQRFDQVIHKMMLFFTHIC